MVMVAMATSALTRQMIEGDLGPTEEGRQLGPSSGLGE